MTGKLLLVIPRVLAESPDGILVDEHFGHNLRAYLADFDEATVACPAMPADSPNMVPLSSIPGSENCRTIILPEPYREDRYLRLRGRISRLLRAEIERADYLLISPHASFEWSTLATRVAIAMGRDYNMEGDWNLQDVVRSQLQEMRYGLQRIRKSLWHLSHQRVYFDSMRHSRLSLLQGAAVFDAYKDIAPNPHKVLNVQVTEADRLPDTAYAAKLEKVRSGAPLSILYTGRVIPMKGPEDWQKALAHAFANGLRGEATWYGDGDLIEPMRRGAVDRGIAGRVAYAGNVDRGEVFAQMREADLFLFCHLTDESPRCLVESITAATPIVGFASLYACDLVAEHGGGAFVDTGDWRALGDLLVALDQDRERLAGLIEGARASSRLYDREQAIQQRIRLMRQHLRPPRRRLA